MEYKLPEDDDEAEPVEPPAPPIEDVLNDVLAQMMKKYGIPEEPKKENDFDKL